ncbi:family 20 glycosylhydrolase [Oerskovia sp. Sa1BUA8]|uniref:beta-N-acetylhexosaminidase n=1 Tax=Oerskovia douganii TaxID=2762210 RepID=A0A9D5U734_9CELL|nr:family 20 glycosylhydrolase [Oerskovia douganii]MBE7699724.1 family 20 glycosylhydrolase [Oerskovia douganii]
MVAIIPQPLHIESPAGGGALPLEGTVLVAGPSPAEQRVAAYAADVLTRAAGTPVAVAPALPDDAPAIVLRLAEDAGPAGATSPERHSIEVSEAGAVLTAVEPVGLFDAVQSLRRLVTEGERGAEVSAVVVHDAPRYAWRGLSFDVARNFFPLAQLELVVDVLASYKLNVLHLHLTDDQGWRIETPSRPELAKLSSDTSTSGKAGGHLSLADFRRLQDYAADRFVTVVPEIDLPGHTNAATAVYGELRADGVPTAKYEGIEVGFSQLTYDLPATEPFLRDVLTDVAAITDGDYIHVGGDEALTLGAEEYAKFIGLLEEIVLETGKKVVAWQEAAQAETRPETLVQYWDNRVDSAPFLAAAERGSRFIMSPGNRAYLDMKYTAEYPLGQDWAGLIELRTAYDWDPATVIEGLPADQVVGVEAAIWTETLSTQDEVLAMLLPRLSAVAEVAWTAPERKDWEDYRRRVVTEAATWRRDGLAFHETPQVDWA